MGVRLLRSSRQLALGIALLLTSVAAEADLGPKQTMQFVFEYRIKRPEIRSWELRECKDASCSTSVPLASWSFPRRFDCDSSSCLALAGHFAAHQKIRITFSDKARESNVFGKEAFNALYTLTVDEDQLAVREVTSQPFHFMSFSRALVLTLVIEVFVAAIYLARLKLLKCLVWVFVANVLSLPVVWFVFPALNIPGLSGVALAELFAVIFEAAVLYLANRKRGLALGEAAILSLLMNAASFSVGLLLPIVGLHGGA